MPRWDRLHQHNEAQAVLFEAANELWRFIVSITTYVIWLERLRRIDGLTVSDGSHNAARIGYKLLEPVCEEYSFFFEARRTNPVAISGVSF